MPCTWHTGCRLCATIGDAIECPNGNPTCLSSRKTFVTHIWPHRVPLVLFWATVGFLHGRLQYWPHLADAFVFWQSKIQSLKDSRGPVVFRSLRVVRSARSLSIISCRSVATSHGGEPPVPNSGHSRCAASLPSSCLAVMLSTDGITTGLLASPRSFTTSWRLGWLVSFSAWACLSHCWKIGMRWTRCRKLCMECHLSTVVQVLTNAPELTGNTNPQSTNGDGQVNLSRRCADPLESYLTSFACHTQYHGRRGPFVAFKLREGRHIRRRGL